ncbi:MAG TPA: hypothetical protein VF572_00685 [Candidatus Saccharimonadales bacterium]|jgi:hypothetical protein
MGHSLEANIPVDSQHDERGSVNVRVGVGLGVLALVGVGAVVAYQKITDLAPEEVGTSRNSRINVNRDDLIPVDLECKSLNLFNTDGSAANTDFRIAGITLPGHFAEMEVGRFTKDGCVDASGITVRQAESSRDALDVDIELSSIRFNTKMQPETLIVEKDDPQTRLRESVGDGVSAVFELGCRAIDSGLKEAVRIPGTDHWIDRSDCDRFAKWSNWNSRKEAQLHQALIAAVTAHIQETCGAEGWKTEKQAVIDSYKLRAFRKGTNPDLIKVNFTDGGKISSKMPNFKQSTDDILRQRDGYKVTLDSPELKFELKECTNMDTYERPKELVGKALN